jgi:hypothetical protein
MAVVVDVARGGGFFAIDVPRNNVGTRGGGEEDEEGQRAMALPAGQRMGSIVLLLCVVDWKARDVVIFQRGREEDFFTFGKYRKK